MVVSEAGLFGGWVWHEGKAVMTGISALIGETPESPLSPPLMWDYSKRPPNPDPRSASPLILELLTFKLWEINEQETFAT